MGGIGARSEAMCAPVEPNPIRCLLSPDGQIVFPFEGPGKAKMWCGSPRRCGRTRSQTLALCLATGTTLAFLSQGNALLGRVQRAFRAAPEARLRPEDVAQACSRGWPGGMAAGRAGLMVPRPPATHIPRPVGCVI